MIKTAKFGGSSLADANMFRRVKSIVEKDVSRRVVVVSAPGKRNAGDNKITDLLYLCHAHLKYGVSCENVFAIIRERFCAIARELGLDGALDAELDALHSALSNRTDENYLVSRGEYLCARLMAAYLGFKFVDAKDCVFFEYDGSVNRQKTDAAIQVALKNADKIVIPGFYGSMPNGSVSVMARGGSDVTGALAAAAVNAGVYENWTDVPGILMADPRIVKSPTPIRFVTYAELRELSYMGAKVLAEESVFPVREKNIPLNIRDTGAPDAEGTLIMESFEEKRDNENEFITGIAGRMDFSIITIHKRHITGELGTVRRVLELFEREKISVEHIPTGVDSFSVVVSAPKTQLYALIGEIEKTCNVESVKLTENISLIAAVGRRMMFRPGISGRLFAALGDNGINIRLISQDAEEISIIVGVDNKDFERTIRVLYDSFALRGKNDEKI